MKSFIIVSLLLGLCAAGPARAQITDDVIRLGILNDQSGTLADWAGLGSVEAAKMAAEDAGGAINGKRIEIVAADHQNKADLGIGIARRWYDQDKVDAIVDVPHAAISQAVAQLARDRKRAALFATTTNDTITGENCGPATVHWVWDVYAVSNVLGKALSDKPDQKWFFLTMDLSFGHQIVDLTKAAIEPLGGKVAGVVRHPLGTADYASFLLQAQAANPDVIAVASAGGDQIQIFKQASEFGLLGGKGKFAGMLVTIADVHGIGLDKLQGAYFPTAFYWDLNDETRAFSARFAKRLNGRMPTMMQAGVYSVVSHYLKAVKELNSDESVAVVRQMKAMPVNDFMTKDVRIREDGRLPRDLYLVRVKTPAESKGPWDYYEVISKVAGVDTVRPLSESKCNLVQKSN